eukprot:15484774-Alexandrium_andersonii.AAC.1
MSPPFSAAPPRSAPNAARNELQSGPRRRTRAQREHQRGLRTSRSAGDRARACFRLAAVADAAVTISVGAG